MQNNTNYSNDFEEQNNDLLTESDRIFISTTLVEEGYLSEKQAKAAVRAGVWTRNARKAQYKYNKVNEMNEEIGDNKNYTENEKRESKPQKTQQSASYSEIAKRKFHQFLIWLGEPVKAVSKFLILVWLLIAMLLGSAISPFSVPVTKDKNAQAMQQVEIEIVTLKILNKIHDSILKNPAKLQEAGDVEKILRMLHNVTNNYWDAKEAQNLKRTKIIKECAEAIKSLSLLSDESEVEAFDTCLKKTQ